MVNRINSEMLDRYDTTRAREVKKFIASVKYGDWEGTSAADGADVKNLRDWLKDNGHIRSDVFFVDVGENRGTHKDPIYVDFLFATSGEHDSVKAMIESNQGPVCNQRSTSQPKSRL